ncbi:MAG: hypothetical protein JSV92_02620 [archaeon]|nr:MAG: hypothetical protein JSV92_02620 [archaeon]
MKYSVLGISLGILAVSILVAGSFFVGFAPKVSAINVTDTMTIDVNVSTLTLVDMNPAEFSWVGVDPGKDTARQQLQIENIGSTNFSKVWFNVTQPADRPFATGDPTEYDAANFLWISRENYTGDSSDPVYFAVDRLEFNESRRLIYLTDPDGNIPPNETKYHYGRFRNTSYEYFWFTDSREATPDDCNGANFYVGDDPHTQAQSGTIDFSSTCPNSLTDAPAGDCRSGTLTQAGSTDWCYANINIGGRNYTIAVNMNGTQVRWSHWNIQFPGGSDFGYGDETFHNEIFSEMNTFPGNSTVADLKIYLPYGVAKGVVSQGILTVFVRSEEGA